MSKCIIDFLKENSKLLDKCKTEKNSNNIFSLIANAYRFDEDYDILENPNSDILRFLLDPKTPEIGDECILKNFCQFIEISDADCSSFNYEGRISSLNRIYKNGVIL